MERIPSPHKKNTNNTEPEIKTGAEGELKDLIQTDDFKKFIKVQEAIGEIEEGLDVLSLDDEEARKIVADYHGWVNAGKPKPQLSKEAKGRIEKIRRITRRKHLGNQYITYIVDRKDQAVGLEWKFTYAKIKQQDGSFIEDKDTIVAREPKYTIPYTEKESKRLIERCQKEAVNPQFAFAMAGRTVTVNEVSNFTGNFDELMKKASKGEVI